MKNLPAVWASVGASVVSGALFRKDLRRLNVPDFHVKHSDMKTLKEIASQLSTEDAVQAIGSVDLPDEVRAFLQGRNEDLKTDASYDAAKIIQKLNAVFEQAQTEMDWTYIDCQSDLRAKQQALESFDLDMAQANAMLEDAVAEQVQWRAEHAASESVVEKIKGEMEGFGKQCELAASQSEALIKMISHDYDVIQDVIKGHPCTPKTIFLQQQTEAEGDTNQRTNPQTTPSLRRSSPSNSPFSFLETSASTSSTARAAQVLLDKYRRMGIEALRGGDVTKPYYRLSSDEESELEASKGLVLLRCSFKSGLSFLTFREPSLAKAMVQMSNKKFRALQDELESLIEAGSSTEVQTEIGKEESFSSKTTATTTVAVKDPAAADKEARDLAKKIRNAQIAGEDVDAEAECDFAGSALCPEFFESLSDLGGDVDTELQNEIAFRDSNQITCDETQQRMQLDLGGWETHVTYCSKHAAALAGRIEELKEIVRNIGEAAKELLSQFNGKQEYCSEAMEEKKSAMCGAIRVKTELMRMNSIPNEIWDCEMSPFEESECSASCGGGTRRWKRDIVLNPSPTYGTKCGASSYDFACNTQECPTHCRTSPWSPWTHCSAECGLGMHYRVRSVDQYPLNGGQSCPSLQDADECDAGICDAPCELTGWTEWSRCSSFCGGGKKTREKYVKKEAIGEGTCPGERSPLRYEEIPCNTAACFPGIPVCNKMIDLVIVVDSSGSIGKKNWPTIVKGVTRIVHQVNLAHVQVGAVIFSHTTETYSVLTSDAAEIGKKFPGNMEDRWMGSVTNTHEALAHAEKLLIEGGRAHEGAEQVVVVLTDGFPCCRRNSRRLTRRKAKDLVNSGIRLIMVPVGNANKRFIREMNRLGSPDSVLPVPKFSDFTKDAVIADIVEHMCDTIVMKPETYKANVVIKDDQLGVVVSTHSSQTT
uniref:VWFA domain-containing protein n=1 Tax=Chromera velia CCMP2878 TaxID=1169474 RepID=A0A0G4H1S6_9ALVE|eukprot:Cvel_24264.t1-p1 / transcript=Cvel_24264.t1 / gene=Cvel_24264 / organism=Chromera_velia_CCMP2878 / gene_product=Hemicentin-1, putative / transcript_product=Hemicentin-1, putative / location=Cvel_scaffold2600:19823-26006(+) / protein_length=932 / sequence_SO=supercontig / SO=protein_coding / is_pseudo=false